MGNLGGLSRIVSFGEAKRKPQRHRGDTQDEYLRMVDRLADYLKPKKSSPVKPKRKSPKDKK